MRAVCAGLLLSVALVGIGTTSPSSAAADDLDAARARLEDLRSELVAVSERYTRATERLTDLNAAIASRSRQIARRARALQGFQKDAAALAVELYKGGSSIGTIEGVLSSQTFADLNRTTSYLQFSGEDQQKTIERVEVDAAELEHELDLLDEERARAQQTIDEIQDIRATVEADSARVKEEVERLAAEEAAAREAELAAQLQAEREAAAAAAAAATQTIVQNPPPPSGAPVPSPSSEADWDAIAMCESGGNWHIDSTYDGGLQFHPNTWLGYGGGKYARYAWQATREQQIAIAEKVLAGQGPGAWPNCFKWK